MSTPRRISQKIKTPVALKKEITKKIRGRGKKIVFTNGIFDILHKGHVTYLEKARKLGTHLIVALNSDDSTKRLKGDSRPINTLADRIEVIAALESVDYVTWFEEDTPLALIKKLMPHVLVKGGDYDAMTIVGSKEVRQAGGVAKTIPFVSGKSTTDIIRRAKLSKS